MQLQCSVSVHSHTILTCQVRQRYSRGILILRHKKVGGKGGCELVITTPGNRNGQIFNVSNTRKFSRTFLFLSNPYTSDENG